MEVHDCEELERALAVDAKLIGVNNRDLRTFEVSLERTREIANVFPFDENRVLISESGIWTQDDAKLVASMGASGVLVGEALMRSGDAGQALRDLQVSKEGHRYDKGQNLWSTGARTCQNSCSCWCRCYRVCFAPSKRRVSIEQAQQLAKHVPQGVLK